MRNKFFKYLVFSVVVFSFFMCGGGNSESEQNKSDNSKLNEIYKLKESPVSVVGKKVKIKVLFDFPDDYLKDGESLFLKPYLQNSDMEIQNFKEINIDNILQKEYEDFEVDYDSSMALSTLFMDVIVKQKNIVSELDLDTYQTGSSIEDQNSMIEIRRERVKLGEGIITTPLLVDLDYKPIFVSSVDNFDVNISQIFGFKKNSSQVREVDLKSDKLKYFRKQIKNQKINISSIDIIGYASPEGSLKFNEELSMNRAKSVRNQIQRIVKDSKVNINNDSYLIRGEGPDWNGFFEMIQMSSISDKDLIRRTLEEESMLDVRASTLKRFMEAYPDIEKSILSNLRRVELRVVFTSASDGKNTKGELLVKLDKDISDMSYEDLLDIISQVDDSQKRELIGKEAINKNPKDYKSYNNYAVALWLNNKKDDAYANFVKAYEIEKNEITSNNLAVSKMDILEFEEAYNLTSSNSSNIQFLYNKGVMLFMLGKYSEALNYLGDKNIFNKALTTILLKDYSGCIDLLNTLDSKPKYEYVKAIAYNKLGNVEKFKLSMDAFLIDQYFAYRYKKDIEFINLENENSENVSTLKNNEDTPQNIEEDSEDDKEENSEDTPQTEDTE